MLRNIDDQEVTSLAMFNVSVALETFGRSVLLETLGAGSVLVEQLKMVRERHQYIILDCRT